MITCRELIDYLGDYLDGALPAEEVSTFEEHLAVCPDCVNYVQSFRDTISLGRFVLLNHEDDVVPPSVPADLVRAIVASRRLGGRDET
ncbi:MAG: anti-sigma factor [Planctomycetes bacterium]|nr:anti-sigma factor [Planctomycetota bacterium]